MGKIYLDIRCGNGAQGRGYFSDISRSGAGLVSTERIAENTAIEMIASNGELIPLKGRVVHLRDNNEDSYRYGIGVKFDAMDETEQWNLDNFIQKRNKRSVPRFSL